MDDVKVRKFLSYGDGSGYGDGDGDGYGDGDGDGYGYGDGDGSGSGSGYGYGYGYGNGNGIKKSCGERIYFVDGVPTIFKSIRGSIAKGFILRRDLTLNPCYVAKRENYFAHGKTIQDAVDAVNAKLLENMDTDEAIEKFFEHFTDLSAKYPAKDFFEWHHYLTGSCEMGRKTFVQDGGFDLEKDAFTVQEFIDITRNAYGKDVILQLEEALKERKGNEN